MANIYKSVDELIGKTPLLELTKIEKKYGLKAKIYAKLEYFNPAGSVKDRIAKAMIDEAEKSEKLCPASVIIEPTSGNTGIGLASVATARGYRIILVMPETMSVERRQLMKAYGAEIVLTDGSKGMKGAIEKAKALTQEIPNSLILGQFTNPANPQAHRESTGPEIYEDTNGKVDIFVTGVGTGGTITGVGEYLKQKNPNIRVVAVEPASSPILSTGNAGSHKIQGIGAGFVPDVLNTKIYDEIIPVTNEAAFEIGKQIGRTEGILVGISSGAALWAAIEIAKRSENSEKNIVVIVIPEHRQRRDLSVPFAYVDIREVINDQRAQRRREHEQRDRDRDQRSRVLPEHSAIQKPHTRKHEYRRTDHGDNRHKKPTFEQQHVPHRRFVFETQPFPDKRYPFDQNFLPRFRRFGRKQYSGFIPHRLHSAKPGKQRNADEGYPERYQIVRKFDPRRERGHRILPLYYYNGSRVKKQVPSRGRT